MEKEKKSEIYITNNFNAPIGQHIDHVDNINLHMDARGGIHVAGDFVVNKNVEYEVNNVENGGIGIQIVNNPQRQEMEVKPPEIHNHFESGSSAQVFNDKVTGKFSKFKKWKKRDNKDSRKKKEVKKVS